MGWRHARIHRPGGVALLIGAAGAATIGGYADDSVFVLVAAVVAALSGLSIMRMGGRLTSFGILWIGAVAVVGQLGAEIPAFGVRAADVALTAFVVACFSSLLRELDAAGAGGWAVGLSSAIGIVAMCVAIGNTEDRALAVLTAGALFGAIAAAPFGSGLLGRVGSRFSGLVIGALAVRACVGSPPAAVAVAGIGGVAFLLWIGTFPRGYRRYGLVTVVVAGGACALGAVPAVLALREVNEPLRRAVTTSRGLVNADPTGDLGEVSARLASSQSTFRQSASKLTAPGVRLGRVVPFLGANLRAATTSAQSAADLTNAASQLLNQVNVSAVSVRGATVPEEQIDALADALRRVQFVIDRARGQVRAGGATDLLVPALREAVENLTGQLDGVERRLAVSLDGTVATKRLLGFDRPKRYFVAVQNTAESRATGGYVANYGILTTDRGRLTLSEFRRTAEFDAESAPSRTLRASKEFTNRYSRFDVASSWPNVNMSPDFPTAAQVMADQYRQFSGRTVDGVLAVDPIALGRLLTLTGPVRVAGWPVPITSRNAVRVALHDQYVVFENRADDRIDFMGRVAKQVFDALTADGLSDMRKAGRVVRALKDRRNLQFFATDELATRFFAATGADGAAPRPLGDSLVVTTQNAAGNKLDYFLRRGVKYDAQVTPIGGDEAAVDATLTIQLYNAAPARGEPRYVIGPVDSRFKPGQHRLFLTVHTPLEEAVATVGGRPLELSRAPELGQYAYSAFVDVPSASLVTVEVRLQGRIRQAGRGYRLDVFRQPVVADDTFELALRGVGANGQFAQAGALRRDLRIDLPIGN